MKKILVLNGPNLNMLGVREPGVYGTATYDDLCEMIRKKAEELQVAVDIKQSNSEGQLVDWIQACHNNADGIVMNPGAYTHYSVAILDALKSVSSLHYYGRLYRTDLRIRIAGLFAGVGVPGRKVAHFEMQCCFSRKMFIVIVKNHLISLSFLLAFSVIFCFNYNNSKGRISCAAWVHEVRPFYLLCCKVKFTMIKY